MSKHTFTKALTLSIVLASSLFAQPSNMSNNNSFSQKKHSISKKEFFQLQVSKFKNLGSEIKTPLFFKDFPFLKVQIARTLFNSKTKQSEILIKIYNSESFPFNLRKDLNIGSFANPILNPSKSTYLIINEESFHNYLKVVSNKNFNSKQNTLISLQNNLKNTKDELDMSKVLYLILEDKYNSIKIENKELISNSQLISSMLDKIFNKFPKKTYFKALKVLNIKDKNLSLTSKFALLRVLLNQFSQDSAKYITLSADYTNLLKEIELLQLKNDNLIKNEKEISSLIYSLADTLELEDLSKKDILKNSINKYIQYRHNLIRKGQHTSKLNDEFIILKNKYDKLAIENIKNKQLLNSFKINNSIEKVRVAEIKAKLINDKYLNLLKENELLKEKNTALMDENKKVFEKYDTVASKVEKLYKERGLLKQKIKKLQGLL